MTPLCQGGRAFEFEVFAFAMMTFLVEDPMGVDRDPLIRVVSQQSPSGGNHVID